MRVAHMPPLSVQSFFFFLSDGLPHDILWLNKSGVHSHGSCENLCGCSAGAGTAQLVALSAPRSNRLVLPIVCLQAIRSIVRENRNRNKASAGRSKLEPGRSIGSGRRGRSLSAYRMGCPR